MGDLSISNTTPVLSWSNITPTLTITYLGTAENDWGSGLTWPEGDYVTWPEGPAVSWPD